MRIQDEELHVEGDGLGEVTLVNQHGDEVARMSAPSYSRKRANAVNFMDSLEIARLSRNMAQARKWKYDHIRLRSEFKEANRCHDPIIKYNRNNEPYDVPCISNTRTDNPDPCPRCVELKAFNDRIDQANERYITHMGKLISFLNHNTIIHPTKEHPYDRSQAAD